jgi:phosphoglycolate phosphatase-like HAD superfamily hydrolase
MTTLVLWDIDRTLLDTGPPHAIYEAGFRAAAGRPATVLFTDYAGRTERGIAVEYLRRNGIPADGGAVDRFLSAVADATDRHRDIMAAVGCRLAGAVDALKALADVGAVQTVVTGNVPATARVKLEVFGLTDYVDLEIGGFGDRDVDRAMLVRRAVRLADAKHGPFPPCGTVVVGDTPRDMWGARDCGVRAVGVATGADSAGNLVAAGADVVLDSLADTGAVLAAVSGQAR